MSAVVVSTQARFPAVLPDHLTHEAVAAALLHMDSRVLGGIMSLSAYRRSARDSASSAAEEAIEIASSSSDPTEEEVS